MTTWTAAQYSAKQHHPDFYFPSLDSKDKVEARYGKFNKQSHPQFTHTDSNLQAQLNNVMFGLINDPSFAARKIKSIDLTPYLELFPSWSGRSKWLSIHKLLVRPVQAILQEMIAAGIPKRYPIYYFGGWSTRYKNSSPKSHAEYAQLLEREYGGWDKARKELYANLPAVKAAIGTNAAAITSDFAQKGDANTTLMLMDLWKGRLRADKVSNHAYGTAIDINEATNGLKKDECDMPPEIVSIFEKHGFSWGGRYKDAMHFEYTLKDAPTGLDEFYGPCSNGESEPPSKIYLRNESNASGYFPLGLFGNIHPGIHLDPGSSAEVRSSLPGVVVAARLCKPGSFPTGDAMHAFAGGHLGMVVIRHCAEIPAKDKDKKPEPISWYSVYQHLVPPKFDIEQDDAWNTVPWYREFLLAEHGSAVVMDPDDDDLLQSVWLTAPFPPQNGNETDERQSANGFPQHTLDKKKSRSYSVFGKSQEPSEPVLSILVPRGTSPKIQEALAKFKEGRLVTFPRPFLSVKAGEPVGVIEASNAGPSNDDIPDAKDPAKVPSYLHWEWFSPKIPGQHGLEKLIELGKEDLTKDLPPGIDRTDAESFLLSKEELISFLKPFLPQAEQADFERALTTGTVEVPQNGQGSQDGSQATNNDYARVGRDYMEKKSSFATDLSTFAKSNQVVSQLAGQKGVDNRNAYPAILELDGTQYADFPAPPLVIGVSFLGQGSKPLANGCGSADWKIDKNPQKERIALWIPGDAHRMLLSCQAMVFRSIDLTSEEEAAQSQNHFQDLVSRRWRGASLATKSEWSTKGLESLLKDLKKRITELDGNKDGKLTADTQKILAVLDYDSLSPLAWYGRKSDPANPVSEWPLLTNSEPSDPQTVFGSNPGQLPDGSLLQMNPVTGLWLGTLLAYKGRIQLGTPDIFRLTDHAKPIFWSFLGDGKRLETRRSMVAVSKSDRTSIDEVASFQLECIEGTSKGRKLVLRTSWSRGVAYQALPMLLWDRWRLSMLQADGSPFSDSPQGLPLLEINQGKPLAGGPTVLQEFKGEKGAPTGQARLRYHFHSHAPVKMRAFLHLLVGVEEEVLKPSGIAIALEGACLASGFDHRLDVEPFGASDFWSEGYESVNLWILNPKQMSARQDALKNNKPWSPPKPEPEKKPAKQPGKKDPKSPAKKDKKENDEPPSAPSTPTTTAAGTEETPSRTSFPSSLSASELIDAIRAGSAITGKANQSEDFRIAEGLLFALEVLQGASNRASKGQIAIAEIRTKVESETVTQGALLRMANEEAAQWAEQWCTLQGWGSIYLIQRQGTQIALSLAVPTNQSGTWTCTFSLAVGLGVLMQKHGFKSGGNTPRTLRVGYQLVFPNGIDLDEIDVWESDADAEEVQESLHQTAVMEDEPPSPQAPSDPSPQIPAAGQLLKGADNHGIKGAQEAGKILDVVSSGFATAGRAMDQMGDAVDAAKGWLPAKARDGQPIQDKDWNFSVASFDWEAMKTHYKSDWIVAEVFGSNTIEPMAMAEPTVKLTTHPDPKSKKNPQIPCLILGAEVKGGDKKAWIPAIPRLKVVVDGKVEDFKAPKPNKKGNPLTQKTVDIPAEWWGKTIKVVGFAVNPQQTWKKNTFQIAESTTEFDLNAKILDLETHWKENVLSVQFRTSILPIGATCVAMVDIAGSPCLEKSFSMGGKDDWQTTIEVDPAAKELHLSLQIFHPSIPASQLPRERIDVFKEVQQ